MLASPSSFCTCTDHHQPKMSSIMSKISKRFSSNSTSRERISKADGKDGNPGPYHDADQEEAPPAYTASASPSSPTSKFSNWMRNAMATSPGASLDDDGYAYLSEFDTIFVIDDSGSMRSYWKEARDAIAAIAPICASRDPDGIDVYYLNHHPTKESQFANNGRGFINIRSADQVNDLFTQVQPSGYTPTGKCLRDILEPYLERYEQLGKKEVKPVNIIVITDGAPSDAPEEVIVEVAQALDRQRAAAHQVGIQFFQVGNSSTARRALVGLDDDLTKKGIRDIVDTVPWNSTARGRGNTLTSDGILKVVLGAVLRRYDDLTVDQMARRRY